MSERPYRQSSQAPGRWGRWAPFLMAAGVVALFLLFNRPAPALRGWHTDYAAALSEAGATDRLVVIAFHLDRCPPCEQMQRSVLNSDEVVRLLEGFVPVQVDAARATGLADRYQVYGTPTYAVVDSHGTLISRCQGFQPVHDFVTFLSRAANSKSKPVKSGEAHLPSGA